MSVSVARSGRLGSVGLLCGMSMSGSAERSSKMSSALVTRVAPSRMR